MAGKTNGLFRDTAGRVIVRLFFARWFNMLAETAVVVFPVLALLAALMWFQGVHWMGVVWAVALIVAWIAGTAGVCWLRRPSPVKALAYWDERAGRKEMYTSAYCFETEGSADVGEQLHLNVSSTRLDDDLLNLKADLPTTFKHRSWALPFTFLVLVGFVLVPPQLTAEPTVDADARAQAKEVSKELAEDVKKIDDDALTPEEQDKLKELEQSLDETVQKLGDLDEETKRDVLAELERKAHEAEQLAEALAAAAGEALSSEMIEELIRHADTTDFGGALKAQKLEQMKAEAGKLADRLEHKDLGLEEQKRVEEALHKAMKSASKSDKQSVVGRKLDQAHYRLRKEQPKKAAQEFRDLAKQFETLAQRQNAQEKLQKLAQQLRNSGKQIFGQNQSGIRKLSKNAGQKQNGLRQLGAKQMAGAQKMALQQRLSNAPPSSSPPKPSSLQKLSQMMKKSGQCKSCNGAGCSSCQGGGQCPVPGSGQKPGGGGSTAPTPGPNQLAAANTPIPGTQAKPGGFKAGVGTAPYGNTRTKTLKTSKQETVDAQKSGQGPSELRDIEAGQNKEQIRNAARDVAISQLSAEEEALADEPLPLSRRDQVLRYFTALRRQLVDQQSTDDTESK